MRELRVILDTARHMLMRGEEGVLATVVKVEGSTYRRPGARLLLTRGGEWVGGVSGGCLEGDLVRKAWWRTEDGPALVTYDSAADDETAWHLGLGCRGAVHVLHERLAPGRPDPLAFVHRCFDARRHGVVATVIRADPATGLELGDRLTLDEGGACASAFDSDELTARVRADAGECLSRDRGRAETYSLLSGEVEVSFEVVRPPVRLVVFGSGFDAVPVVAAGKALGWHVAVVGRRPGLPHRPAFAPADEVIVAPPHAACQRLRPDDRTAAVVMNHHVPDDRDALCALLDTPAGYVGVLGPRTRTEKILAEIPGLDRHGPSRLYAPIGLDIGADAPDEIAAAVVAQIIAVFAGRSGGHLADKPGPIHKREPVRSAERVS